MVQSNLISARIAFENLSQTADQLKGMGAAGEAAFRQIQQASGSLAAPLAAVGKETSGLTGHFAELQRSLDSLSGVIGPAIGRFNRFTREFSDLRGIIAVLGPAMKEFGEVGIGVGLFLAAKKGAEAIRELNDQAKILGVSIESLQKLQYAASQAGVDAEKFTKGFERASAKAGEVLKVREDFEEKAGLLAGQAQEENLKTANNIDRAKEALARANREQVAQASNIERTRIEAAKLNVEQDKYRLATDKLHQQTQFGGIALGPNMQTSIALREQDIKLDESKRTASESLRKENESYIKTIENTRAAHAHLAEAQVAASNIAEKHRIEADKQRDVFQRLGVDISKTADVWFVDLIDKLGKVDDATKRNAYSREIFGRDWMAMGKIVAGGVGEIRKSIEEYEHRIVGITGADAHLAEEFEKTWSTVSTNFKNIFNIFGVLFGQVFKPVIDGVSAAIKGTEKNVREFTQALVDVLSPGIRAVMAVFRVFGTTVIGVLNVIIARFDNLAAVVNKFAGTNLTGADIIVGLILLRSSLNLTIFTFSLAWTAVTTLTSAFYSLAAAIVLGSVSALRTLITTLVALRAIDIAGWLVLFAARIVDLGKALVTLRLGAFLQLLGGANPLFLALKVAIVAVGAAMLLWPSTFGGVFKWFSDGIKGISDTVLALYNMLLRVAVLQGAISEETYKKLSTEASPGVPGTGSSGSGSGSSEDVGQRVEQETANSPSLSSFIHRAFGGPIPGSGRGDHVPVVAEPGEFMVQRSAVSRVGMSFMHMLNNGIVPQRMNAGGLVAAFAGMPQSSRVGLVGGGGGSTGEGTALFHLTIGDRTYRNLSAPQSTAQDMLKVAREQSRTQMAPAQGWKK